MSEVEQIAFANLNGIPYSKRRELAQVVGSVDKLFESNTVPLDSEQEALLRHVRAACDRKRAEEEFKKLKKIGGWVKSIGNDDYPYFLSQIADPPLVIFGVGEWPKNENQFLSMVGPRKPTAYGARIAKMLAQDLVNEGLILVSGMARGIDAIAHESALAKKRPTLAVMANGIDQTYPPEHALLKSKIAKCGAVITEFSWGERPRKEYFPQRNRIISGLSKGTLIVEAGEKSGARITARHAAEQSREVYAVPGPIDSPLSMVPNLLIAQGAKIVQSTASILEDYFPEGKTRKPASRADNAPDLSGEARKVLTFMEMDQPMAVDELLVKGKFSVGSVLQSLIELELKGVVAKRSDARYVRVIR